ncbi:MAG: hypothetical protein IJH75_00050 [Mogibacterium sp.]|nr:hypothetical protein [Mogibacterium sp.]
MRALRNTVLTGALCGPALTLISLSGLVLGYGIFPGTALAVIALLLMVWLLPAFRGAEAVWAGALGPFALTAGTLLWLQRLLWANGCYGVMIVDLTMLMSLYLLALGPQELLLVALAGRLSKSENYLSGESDSVREMPEGDVLPAGSDRKGENEDERTDDE